MDGHTYGKDIERILIQTAKEVSRETEHTMKNNPGGGMLKCSVQ